ncbi:DUF3987 domain-containing protein [Vineibacter terrae]|uniref:DUF3987 domain-containing protein n=1 Tax=Vineibacter terrae TaxID=2586908 RepID=A0A5C8PGR4_9HYPH|nr:DUF3987 domain-containing protein [Vineibacter terrae]TXL72707.1 DUF3987 domain-containing protein [Vineibacter terrae]
MSAHDFASLTHADHGTPLRWWHYTDSFAVAGFRGRDGRKRIAMAVRTGAQCYWHEPLAPLPLYGAAGLQARPAAPVLVVQNEAIADGARPLFPDHVCIAWAGGCGAVDKADIVPLRGRDVVAWPDDDAGATAMARLQVRLRGWAHHVALIAAPRAWPAPWHGDDPPKLPEAAVETLRRQLREALPDVAADPPSSRAQRGISCEGRTVPQSREIPRCARDDGEVDASVQPNATETRPAPTHQDIPHTIEDPPSVPDTGWAAPDLSLLDDRRGELPALPPEALPLPWRSWVEQAARGAGVPIDPVALSLLTAASGLIGTARWIAPAPSWSEPCILWTAVVGPPSSGKTPAVAAVLDLVRLLQDELDAAYEAALHVHDSAFEDARGQWVGDLIEAVRERRAPPPQVVARPPLRRSLLAAGAGIAAIVATLRNAPRGVLLARDGRGSWLADIVRDCRGAGDDVFWLAAWAGAGWTAAGRRQSVSVDSAVSILGTLRPEALGAALGDDSDGVAARLLYVWPHRAAFRKLPDAAAEADVDAVAALARLRDMPDGPREVPLASDARAAFDRFRRLHYVAAGRQEGRAAAWWGKGPGTVLRLAGVMAFLDWAAQPQGAAEPQEVPAWAVEAAAALWQDYLWPHARAAIGAGGNGTHDRHLRDALRWLAQQRPREVSREQLRREAMRQSLNAAGTDRIIAGLVERGCLRLVTHATKGRARRRWLVNPALRENHDA